MAPATYTIWNPGGDCRPYGEGRDEKEYRIDTLRTNYNIIDSGHFHIDYGTTSSFVGDSQSPGMKLHKQYLEKFNYIPSFDDIKFDIATPLWQILVTEYSESHKESNFVFNSFSDSHVLFTMGAMPIEVSISGFVPSHPDYNASMDFVAFYRHFLRGSKTRIYDQATDKYYKVPLGFTLVNTFMKLNLISMQLVTTVEVPDFSLIRLQGIAYNYRIISRESFYEPR